MNIKIINKPLPLNKYRIKAPYNMTPIGITIHETDNNAPARNEVAYMQSNNNSTSFHFAVDENEIIQGAPLNKNTWHAGGRRGNGNMRTISIEICRNYRTNDLTNYYKARVNAEKLAGYLLSKYNWNESNIYTHNHWSGKNCPRVILREGYLTTFKKNAMRYKNGQLGEPSKPVAQGKPIKPKLSNKEIAKLVLKGDYGNGQTRITKLTTEGYNPKEVQKEVDILTGKNKSSQPSKPKLKSVATIAKEVIDGKWGNGDERKRRLQAAGYNYSAVQNEVNKFASTTKSNKKSNEAIAKEVIAGKWGNGAERKRRLEAAGYNYNTIQKAVNRLV